MDGQARRPHIQGRGMPFHEWHRDRAIRLIEECHPTCVAIAAWCRVGSRCLRIPPHDSSIALIHFGEGLAQGGPVRSHQKASQKESFSEPIWSLSESFLSGVFISESICGRGTPCPSSHLGQTRISNSAQSCIELCVAAYASLRRIGPVAHRTLRGGASNSAARIGEVLEIPRPAGESAISNSAQRRVRRRSGPRTVLNSA